MPIKPISAPAEKEGGLHTAGEKGAGGHVQPSHPPLGRNRWGYGGTLPGLQGGQSPATPHGKGGQHVQFLQKFEIRQ